MKKLITKILQRPISNQIVESENIQLWYVRWNTKTGDYMSDTEEVIEAFTSEEDANEFKQSLKNAAKLLKFRGFKFNFRIEKN